MFRKTARIFAALLFTFCCLTPVLADAQTTGTGTSTGSNNYQCIAYNRNWICGVKGTPGVAVTQCIATVRGGAVISQKDYSFSTTTALQAFLNMPPSGYTYQLCSATPACTQTIEDQTLACPSGQTGQIVQRRTDNVNGVCGTNSAYTEISNTCKVPPACTQTTETQPRACPAGQTGSITDTRAVNVGGVCGTNSDYTETSNTCKTPPANCTFNGQTVLNGQSVVAYSTQTTAYGTTCAQETRMCNDGVLSGSYQYSNCTPQPPATCTFNGKVLNDGDTVTAFQTQTTAYGTTCISETRKCTNGSLSGNYGYSDCTVNPPATCIFNGKTLKDGESVTAYATQTTAYGTTCVSEKRTCSNGSLSGSYNYSNCTPQPPATCSFNGKTLNDGDSVTAYSTQTSPYGTTCLSEQRICHNGVLSGNYTYNTCSVNPPATCTLNGQVLQNGQSVTVYQTANVPYGQVCKSETRTCSNGVLSGEEGYGFTTCVVNPPLDCTGPFGTVKNGDSIVAFQSPTAGGTYAQAGDAIASTSGQCVSETRTCNNGVLLGQFTYKSCNQQCGASTETRSGVTACPAGQSGTITETRNTNVGQQCGVNGEWTVVSNTCAANLPDIPTVMAQNPTIYSTFRNLLDITGLIPGLSCPETGTCYGPFTVFAPRNEAFRYLSATDLAALQQPSNYDTLRQVLRTHIVNGKYLKAVFVGKTTDLATQSGYAIRVTVPANGNNGTVSVVGSSDTPANVVEWDRLAKNGVIHTIDRVLMPVIVCQSGYEHVTGQYTCAPVCQAGTTRDQSTGQCLGNVCTFNGQTIQNGQSVTAFSTGTTAYGTVCKSETRTCNNGQLSGSYQYTSCTPGQPATCTFNGQTLQNGQSVTAYKSQTTAYGTTCVSEQRTCNNGQLSGGYGYSNCTPNQPQTCSFNGQTIQNGASVIAYQSSGAAYGQQCQAEYRTCNNGVLSGSYNYSNCSVTPAQNCTFNGQTVMNGSSVTAYRYSMVGYGDSCYGSNTETRVCNNGQLSGSFNYSSCTTQQPQSCTGPDGRVIASGSSVSYYAQSNPSEGSYCQGQVRTCTNGVLSGNYSASSCVQVICTTAQAGDAIAKACTTGTYASAGQTNSSTSTTMMPGNSGSTGTSGSNGSTGNSSNSSSSSSSSYSGGSITINNQNSNANNVTSNNSNQTSIANNNSSNSSNNTSVAVSTH